MAEREPPNSASSEAGLVSIFLNDGDGDVLAECLEQGLKPAMFFSKKYRLIFCSCLDLYSKGEPICKNGVVATLTRRGKLDEVGESEINSLADNKENAVHASHHVEILKDKAFRRKLIKTTQKAVETNFPDNATKEEILDTITRMFLTAGENITAEGVAEARACKDLVRKKLWELFTDARGCGFSLHGTLRILTRLVERLNRRPRGE